MTPLNAVNEQKPRQIAARILGQRRAGGEFVEDLLEIALANAPLSSADRGLCQEIVYGVVRWQATLDWLIARKTNGREQTARRCKIFCASASTRFSGSTGFPHAAVHETVELAKHTGFGPQAGFVNAVLRGYLREADETRKLLAELKISQPALGFSHPRMARGKMAETIWRRKHAAIARMEQHAAENLCARQQLKTDAGQDCCRKDGARKMSNTILSGATGRRKSGLRIEIASAAAFAGSFRDGWFYIQDPSTLLAVRELGAQPGETILDLCAAPGGKTTFIAQLMNNEGKIVAATSPQTG